MAFKPGDLIWAKMRGYPHWPARIDLPAENEKIPAKKFPIFFFGTHETAVMQGRDLFEYEKYKAKYGKPSNRKFFNEALEEIIKDPKVRYGQRGQPTEESESEESSEDEEESKEEEKDENETEGNEVKPNKIQGKRKSSTENKIPAKKKKTAKEEEPESEPEVTESEESSESEPEEYIPEEKSKPKKAASAKKTPLNKAKKSKQIISSDESSEEDDDEDQDEKKSKGKEKTIEVCTCVFLLSMPCSLLQV
ncbi:hepatoma-derived growth factor-related protein 3 [Exaiptasia diaphana]|uniref:PWWP domain-containing protein n=1 Tax=Exaiptasia diaphana TaxID=2652724 RepID=A0A913X7W2_EXADI|nr:hepatoma-derived growth factor-related protein 3 [Exaiptasia diaphana]KXJ28537.1 PC4 and SFRS1-interacting protein [Exaiptasia diaphana]